MHRPDVSRAQHAHFSYKSDGTVPAGDLDAMIEDSWKRSIAFGLTEDLSPEYAPLARDRMSDALEGSSVLVSHARPVMQTLYEQIVDTQSMLILTDAEGLILHSLGDDDFLERADKVALKPGVVWSEESKGTNAIGTAIAEQAPVLVHGPEHFLSANHFLTCSATPIADPHGKLIGVLDVSGDWRSYHRHTMALVRMSANLIENHLFSSTFADAMVVCFHSCPEFIGTLCEGMIAFRPDGSVLSANKSSLFQLGLGLNGLRTHTFASLFNAPFSALMDHVRNHGLELMPLTMPTGVRVFARARIGVTTAETRRVFSHTAPARTTAPNRAPATGDASGASHDKATSLAALNSGDPQVELVIRKAQKVVGTDISLLIQGETGTGKELFARAIHNDSPRNDGPFVAVNCASIPETLIESELFGYEEGAFTGARRKGSVGKILMANGGTLFLDEIGDMPPHLQARLLRVLQERVVMPLGSGKSISVDLSIICATHRRLKDLIAQGQFREDLYYRLNGLTITLPPLRMRQDLAEVARRILRNELKADPALRLSTEVLDLFRRHPWPGNLRQLSNVLRTAVVMADGEEAVRAEHLPDDFFEDLSAPQAAAPQSAGTGSGRAYANEQRLEDIELSVIQQALDRAGGNVSAAARALGISRNTIYRKLRPSEG